jgi:hypothetical protein
MLSLLHLKERVGWGKARCLVETGDFFLCRKEHSGEHPRKEGGKER